MTAVEWVETTARTIEEAKDAALDQLGVDEQEAEFEVLEEPRAGLFGRVRGEARVRARVAPKAPRPKTERRDRKKKVEAPAAGEVTDRTATDAPVSSGSRRPGGRGRAAGAAASSEAAGPSASAPATARTPTDGGDDDEVVSAVEQAVIVRSFLEGLLVAFGATGELTTSEVDEDTVEVAVAGDDLGLLIGPKGQTLLALQDLSRTVLQRRAPGRHDGRVRIDVSGYRSRRRDALVRFTEGVAEQVKTTGVQKALEPMGAADRKIVHDTANEIAGVATLSEGEDPRRRVVILPADD